MTSKLLNKKISKQINAVKLAELFKYFADPHRLNIMMLLSRNETSVTQLACQLESTISAVSHQLKQLHVARLVSKRRDGKIIYYRLLDEHVHQLVAIGVDHINEKR